MSTPINGGPIIFPLRERLFTSALFLQTRPRSNGGRRVVLLPTLPWDDGDRPPTIGFGRVDKPPILAANVWPGFGLCAIGAVMSPLSAVRIPTVGSQPAVVHALKVMPATFFQIAGVTRDSAGARLGNCVVELYRTIGDAVVGDATSNADGNYYVKGARPGVAHYIVAYKAGAPDLAGTTLNTLQP
jgi:hypothetical protein